MNVKSIKFIDKWIGKPLCFVIGSMIRKDTDKVAFIQLFGVGETILTLPAIKGYKEKNPKKKITIICTVRNKEIYEGLDFIDEIRIISFNVARIMWFMITHSEAYDEVYDFEEYLNVSALIAVFIGRTTIGFDHSDRAKVFSRTVPLDDKKHFVYNFCDLVGVEYPQKLVPIVAEHSFPLYTKTPQPYPSRMIGIFPGTAESAKWRMWPAERFVELASELEKRGFDSIIVLGPHEKDDSRFDKFSIFRGNLHQLARFCLDCKYFISADTGPMHVAAAMGTRTIGLFGPNTKIWAPFGPSNISIYHPMPCSPCIHNKTGDMGGQCKGDNKCMLNISVEEVLKCINLK